MRKRAGLLRELRASLVREAIREGLKREAAESYATREMAEWAVELSKNKTLRQAVQGCR